jgi:hypothetical protein
MIKTSSYLLLVLISLFYSCSGLSNYEKEYIKILNDKYCDYSFVGSGSVYLSVHLKKEVIDTFELKSIFTDVILAKDSVGRTINEYRSDLSWVYMNIYKNNKFMFQISKDIYGNNEFKVLNVQYY